MTSTLAAPPTPPAQTEVLTPKVGRVLKRSLFWVGVALFVIVLGIASIVGTASTADNAPLDSDNPAPGGAMAVAEVLAQQGVDVIRTTSLADTRAAIDSPADTTLLIYDNGSYLDAGKLRTAIGLADTVILVDPDFAALRAAAPELALAGQVSGVLDADCDVPVVQRAETVSGEGFGYRIVGDSSDVTACLGSGDDVYSMLRVDRDGSTLTVLGATGALTNELVIQNGNAAFALGLLGEHDTLVWYLPSFDDLDAAAPETIAELTPAWVIPLAWLLIITFTIAAIWRGRRLGPLVVENLPVTVRASETMLGRARLYEKSSARLRALDSLRIGSVQRLALACGLPTTATVDDVIASVTSVTGRQVSDIRAVLIDAIPANDRELIQYSDALLTLEHDVARATRP